MMPLLVRSPTLAAEPRFFHGGASEMFDGSEAPARIQWVFDMQLAHLPSICHMLASFHLSDLLGAPVSAFSDKLHRSALVRLYADVVRAGSHRII